jgi:dolichyl-diphosphooligosaccharide---protein glycosyltransferase
MDLNLLVYLFPCGVWICFRELKDEHVFLIIYSVLASYFAGVMVRLILVLTPVVCITAAVAVSSLYETYLDPLESEDVEAVEGNANGELSTSAVNSASGSPTGKKKKLPQVSTPNPVPVSSSKKPIKSRSSRFGIRGIDTRLVILSGFTVFFGIFVMHCTYVTSTSYSSPSVVLASQNPDGSQHIIDDFREAYYWLRMNTEKDAKVMSWWDYGYQIAGFADRYTLVDNNTWNNTQYVIAYFIDLDLTSSIPVSLPSERPCHRGKKFHTLS